MADPKTPIVSFVNLGCRVNRVETDTIASALEAAGCIIGSSEEADAIIVNTCAVTGEAEAKTRKVLRHAAHLPQGPLVFATGCVANLFADELESLGANIQVVPLKPMVAGTVLSALGMDGCGTEVPSSRPTPTGRTRPGIKIQDGCDNRCSYCIVWKARGAARSVDLGQVVEEARAACSRGAQEIVLTGINLGQYRSAEGRLPELLETLLEQTEAGRIRLSSIEPPDVDARLIEVMAENPERIAPFLHVCLQSGSDTVLSRMRRAYDTALYRDAVEAARSGIPNLALGCDLIVGFPGETEAEHAASLAFSEEMRFAKMHIFRYSRRPGTPAAEAPDQVPPETMAERAKAFHALAGRMRAEEAARLVGQEDIVLVQEPGQGITGGLFEAAIDPALPVDTLHRMRIVSCDSRGRLVAEL